MKLPLQAHYLDIEWRELGRVREITVAPEPIEIEENGDGTLVAETQVFHDLRPWVGLRLDAELDGVEPAFERSDGHLTPMLKIEDGRGGHWWVQNDGWDALGKRHLSELHRSMGQFTIVMGARRLVLINVVDELSRVEVEDYLRDFQQDLIWLVMGFGGASASTGGGLMVNQKMVEALEAFAAASRRVLDNPARHVREIQIESRPARLRPSIATFRQYLRNPSAKKLPGRGADETPDIADNRYLRHMVKVCEKLSSHIAQSAMRHAQRFADRARVESVRSASYQNMTQRKVDPDVFDRQLAELKKKLRRIEEYSDSNPDPEEAEKSLEFRPGNHYGNNPGLIFFNNKNGSKAEGESKGKRYKFSVLRIPESLIQAIQVTKSYCDYYVLTGAGYAKFRYTQNGDPYREIHFTKIFSAKPFTNAIARKEAKREQLEKNNWLARLTPKEIQENRQEGRTAYLRGEIYRQYSQQAAQASSALNRFRTELRAQNRDWQSMGVASSAAVPMGVRFSQSPNYTTCQVAFSKITQLVQCGGLTEDALDSIDRIGVLHASALYERWCLVKILSVLIEDFRFKPQAGWQERLVQAIAGKPESLELRLHREDVEMLAVLEVQPELSNGRRPDFRLRFFHVVHQPVSDNESHEGVPSCTTAKSDESLGGLVMDAKFRTRWYRGELGRMLNSLIAEKGYDQEGDRVFILHPAAKAILKPTSPLSWGKECDYGQEVGKMHKRGVVYLAPGSGEANPESNLRRLIVMQLQSSFAEPVEYESNGHLFLKIKSFCIRCGKVHEIQDVKQHLTQRGRKYWTLTCNECGMQTTRTHCYSCDSSVLFKNGLNLTYHRTVADQVTNIVCPQCGKYFDNDIHDIRNTFNFH